MTLPHSGRPDTDDVRAEDERELLEAVVPLEHAGRRFDQALADLFPDFSRSRLTSWIKSGEALLDGAEAKPKQALRGGETVTVWVTPSIETTAEPEAIALDLRHADDEVIVLNKPAGLVVHPGAGNPRGTLVNALLHFDPKLAELPRAGIVHRLDKDTSGLLVAAKHDAAHQALSAAFSVHAIERIYSAIALGCPRPAVGTIDAPLARAADRIRMAVVDEDSGRPDLRRAVTHYRAVEIYGRGRAKLAGDALASLLDCTLETGRTHQIRVHLASIGHPLIGDPAYGRGPGLSGLRPGEPVADRAIAAVAGFRRQALHARVLGFEHPVSGEALRFEAEPPEDFKTLREALAAL